MLVNTRQDIPEMLVVRQVILELLIVRQDTFGLLIFRQDILGLLIVCCPKTLNPKPKNFGRSGAFVRNGSLAA